MSWAIGWISASSIMTPSATEGSPGVPSSFSFPRRNTGSSRCSHRSQRRKLEGLKLVTVSLSSPLALYVARKSVVCGKGVEVRVDMGGLELSKKKITKKKKQVER